MITTNNISRNTGKTYIVTPVAATRWRYLSKTSGTAPFGNRRNSTTTFHTNLYSVLILSTYILIRCITLLCYLPERCKFLPYFPYLTNNNTNKTHKTTNKIKNGCQVPLRHPRYLCCCCCRSDTVTMHQIPLSVALVTK